jgi:acetyl-CoA synthetase
MSGRYNLAHDLLDRRILKGGGERRALLFSDSAGFERTYTWRQLAVLANRFGYVLRGLGVGRGDRVLFRVPNHPAFYYGALGCARIGAVFVPTSTLFKEAEIGYRLRDSGAVVVVTTTSLAPEVEAASAHGGSLREILIVDDDGEPPLPSGDRRSLSRALASAKDHVPLADTDADDPAFLAYTSGTTGDPKGILHAQRYARSYDYLIRDWHGYRESDLCACPAEIGWMLPVASTFLYAMRAGAGVFLYREREPRFRPEAWLDSIARHRITNFVGTPTIYRMLLTVEDAHRRFDSSSLRRGTSAGEPLPAPTFEAIRERFGFPPLDGIGMSECMVYAHNRDPRDSGEDVVPGSCGRAGAGIELAVLDDDLAPVGSGEEGVLCVKRASHPGLMLEYWRKPEATKEVFRGDWYWSGDVVRRDESGRFTFVARADDVMKCSGYRISPFEIESVLQSHPAVLEAAAVESPDPTRGAVVKAFVTLRAGVSGDEALSREIERFVKEKLAPFKVPKRIAFVAELPKTQSGKIKRRMLRDAERRSSE